MNRFFTISKGGLSVELCRPCAIEGYYRGTRFDWAGVFHRIIKEGRVYADEWFDNDEPYRHDNVCGLSEEFVIDGNRAAGPFVKIGVGRLSKEEGPYDRFKLYPIIDAGERSLSIGDDHAVFTHSLMGEYEYEKRIELIDGETLRISHMLKNLSAEVIDTHVYNHNFFTFDNMHVGPAVRIDFPGRPYGTWREVMPQVGFGDNSIIFHDYLLKGGKTAFIGDLTIVPEIPDTPSPVIPDTPSPEFPETPSPDIPGTPSPDIPGTTSHVIPGLTRNLVTGFSFRISNTEKNMAVDVRLNSPVAYSVFWSNHRVACIEPYNRLIVAPGESCSWSIDYKFL